MKVGFALRLPFRLRVFFRAVFLLLALAVLALAVNVLQDEKQRAHAHYAEGLARNQAQIAARLRHPTGQLMLMNPALAERAATPLRPLLLPFAAIDFDDRSKARQAVELAGCGVQYPDGSTVCAGIGTNAWAGGFIYLVATFAAGDLVPRAAGEMEFGGAHRAEIELDLRGQTWRWLAPFEALAGDTGAYGPRGRLVGYAADAPLAAGARPVRDFRGWLWQDARCLDGGTAEGCLRRSFASIRLPVEPFREALATREAVAWPPPDIAEATLRLRLRAPGDGAPLLDSDTAGARVPFSIADFRSLLLPGETLRVQRQGSPRVLLQLAGEVAGEEPSAPWLDRLVRQLPVERFDAPPASRETVDTPLGRYEVVLAGDVRSVNRQLAGVATRLTWFVGAMVGAITLTWLLLEWTLIRRMTLLTRRAAAASAAMRSGAAPELDLKDLRGGDELGVLAQGLRDLLDRVNDDIRRERIRVQQEKDQWHAVGHEIMSPLQSLLALHDDAADPSRRYLTRMQQAVRVLYGQASPSEAFAATSLDVQALDLDAFLGHVAGNATYIGIADVHYAPLGRPCAVRADEHSLEDVVTHLLRNAARFRTPGTPVTITLADDGREARVVVHNTGPAIPGELIERVFDYGVSTDADEAGHRGQGLFVARTYLAKMGGRIAARNVEGGVEFEFGLVRETLAG